MKTHLSQLIMRTVFSHSTLGLTDGEGTWGYDAWQVEDVI